MIAAYHRWQHWELSSVRTEQLTIDGGDGWHGKGEQRGEQFLHVFIAELDADASIRLCDMCKPIDVHTIAVKLPITDGDQCFSFLISKKVIGVRLDVVACSHMRQYNGNETESAHSARNQERR